MNIISKNLLITKAKKELGEGTYANLKKSFLDTFNKVCEDKKEDKFCKKSLRELWLLKNQMWVQTLMQVLGPAMIGTSLLNSGESRLSETIITCGLGVLITIISNCRKHQTKELYQASETEFLNYICSKNNLNMENTNQSIELIPYKDACNELVDQAKNYDLWQIERSM